MDDIIFNHNIDKNRLADFALFSKMISLQLPKHDLRRSLIEEDVDILEQLIAEQHPSLNKIQNCVETLDDLINDATQSIRTAIETIH